MPKPIAPFNVMRSWKIVCTVCIGALCARVATAADLSQDLVARLKAESKVAWKIVNSADELPGTINVTTQIEKFSKGKLAKKEEKAALVKRKPGHYRFEAKQSKQGFFLALGQNPLYSFVITRKVGEDSWRLNELGLKGEANYGEIPPDIFQYLKPNSYGFILTLGPLSKLTSEKHFQILRAEHTEGGDVRVDFQTVVAIPNLEIAVKGRMDLDASNSWALRHSEYQTSTNGVVKLTKTFLDAPGMLYQPCTSWHLHSRSTDENTETKQVTQYEIIDATVPSDSDFYLTAFGLPEPMGIVAPCPSPTNWYIWFTVFAGVSLTFGVYFRFLSKRRQPQTQNSNARSVPI